MCTGNEILALQNCERMPLNRETLFALVVGTKKTFRGAN